MAPSGLAGTNWVCTDPGADPSTGHHLIQLQLSANGSLGSSQGEALMRVFIDKLNANCRTAKDSAQPISIDGFTTVIGNGAYNIATIYGVANDPNVWLAGCPQTSIQLAANQANLVDLNGSEAATRTFATAMRSPQVQMNTLWFDSSDYDVRNLGPDAARDPTGDTRTSGSTKAKPKSGTTKSNGVENVTPVKAAEPAPEGEGGAATPAVPKSTVLKIRTVTLKRQTQLVPRTCVKTSLTVPGTKDINCRQVSLMCDIACPYGHACELNNHCGSFGKCDANKCVQTGVVVPPQPDTATALSAVVAALCVVAAIFFF